MIYAERVLWNMRGKEVGGAAESLAQTKCYMMDYLDWFLTERQIGERKKKMSKGTSHAYRSGASVLFDPASALSFPAPALRMDVSTSLQYQSLSSRRWWNLAFDGSWCGGISARAMRSLSGHRVRL